MLYRFAGLLDKKQSVEGVMLRPLIDISVHGISLTS